MMNDTMHVVFADAGGMSCSAGSLGSFWSSDDVLLVIILAGLAFLAYRHIVAQRHKKRKNIW